MQNNFNDYYVGLDVGSNSVGYSVTNENFDLLRIKGKTAFGSHLFDQASDSKSRRIMRCNKRRLNRRKSRIYILNKIFESELNKIDDTFLLRLSESNYKLEDKSVKIKYPLFLEKNKEKQFYKDYKTIYKLRYDLMLGDEKALSDLRNIYLAIHSIIKYRGNFLTNGPINTKTIDNSIIDELNLSLESINKRINGVVDEDFDNFIEKEKTNDILDLLKNDETDKQTKKKTIKSFFNNVDSKNPIDKYIDLFCSLVVGGTYSIKNIEDYAENKDLKICFDNSYDENEEQIKSVLEDDFTIVKVAKEIYDFVFISKLLDKSSTISEAYMKIYNDHEKELEQLKNVVKEIDENKKVEKKLSLTYLIFKDKGIVEEGEEKNKDDKKEHSINYGSLVGVSTNCKKCSIEDFDKKIIKLLSENKGYCVENKNLLDEIIKKAEKNTFLRTISLVSNSTVPHQLHEKELEAILANASKKYAFINENKAKILELFRYRVNYAYGPLNENSVYSNIIVNDLYKGKHITFDNYKDAINISKTKEKFMTERTNYCSYILNEYVLPKNALSYTLFIVLNRLNSMTINGVRINDEEKKFILSHVFKNKKTTIDNLDKVLREKYFVNGEALIIGGINLKDDFCSDSMVCFSRIYGENELFNKIKEADDIVKVLTVYKDQKQDALDYIKKVYKYNEKMLSILNEYTFKNWGTLSAKLIYGIKDEQSKCSILDLLYESQQNFEQIYNNNNYTFKKQTEDLNSDFIGVKSKNEIVDYLLDKTPAIFRRSAIQTLKIIKEIVRATKKTPKIICLEVTREDNIQKSETYSRKHEIKTFLNSVIGDKKCDFYKNDGRDLLKDFEEEKVVAELKNKHIYRYFMQLGYDLYSGKKIDINDLMNSDKYDIDHIVPQSLIKDDSMDNTVLVSKDLNEKVKKNIYPVNKDIQTSCLQLWRYLKNKKAISQKKFDLLTRKEPLTDDELNEFVNRQINGLNYSNKVIVKAINFLYPNTQVVFSKAQYPSFVRKEFGIYKIRELNDAHHAIDAYLNVVCGVILNKKFGNLAYIKADKNCNDNSDLKLLNGSNISYKSYNFETSILNYIDNNNLKDRIIKNCFRHDVLMTYRLGYYNEEFYNQTIYRASDSSALIPLHTKTESKFLDTSKYGGYLSLHAEYFVIGKYNKKGKEEKILITVSHFDATRFNDKELSEYLKNKYASYDNLRFDLKQKIMNNQKVIYKKNCYLLFNSNEGQVTLKNISQLYFNKEDLEYIYYLKRFKEYNFKSEESVNIFTDRKQEQFVTINKTKNTQLLNLLISESKKEKYLGYNTLNALRNCDVVSFIQKNINEEIKEIFAFISLFSKELKVTFKISKNLILSKSNYFISDNTSGLFTKKILIK